MMNETDLEARSAFFSKANHDFRQRLHAMKLLTQSALGHMGPQASVRLAQLTEVTDDLDTYISGVLDFARLDSPALLPRKTRVDLQDLFQKIDLQFEDQACHQGVQLCLRPTNLSLLTDAAMLQRVLDNLVSNAIRFTRGRVLVAARPRGRGCAIEVWDQGPGIHPGTEKRIFEAFYQDHRVCEPNRKRHSTGLGLAVVKRLADSLGYRVAVQSVVGKGSVMRVLIPPGDRL